MERQIDTNPVSASILNLVSEKSSPRAKKIKDQYLEKNARKNRWKEMAKTLTAMFPDSFGEDFRNYHRPLKSFNQVAKVIGNSNNPDLCQTLMDNFADKQTEETIEDLYPYINAMVCLYSMKATVLRYKRDGLGNFI